MSQPNHKNKRLESLFSEAKPAEPDPATHHQPGGEVDSLKARVAALEAELEAKLTQQEAATSKTTTFETAKGSDHTLRPSEPVEEAQSSSLQELASNALRIGKIGLPASILAASFYLYLALQFGHWQLYAWSVDIWVLALAVFTSIVLTRRGRVSLGAGLLLTAIPVTFLGATALIEGIGVLLGVSIVLLVSIIAGQTLSAKAASRAIVFGVISGVAAILLDVFLPPYRLPQPEPVRVFLPGILGVVILLFGYVTVRQFRNYKLRTKLIIGFIAIVVGSVGVVAFLTNRSLQTSLTEDIGSKLSVLASAKASEIGQSVDREADVLKALALNKTIQDAAEDASRISLGQAEIERRDTQWRAADSNNNNLDALVASVLRNDLASELMQFQEEFPQHVEVFLTDRQGNNIAATNRTSDYYQADEEWWQIAYQDGLFIGQPEFDESSKTVAMIMAVAVRANGSGRVVGVLRTTVDFETLTELLASGLFGQTGHTDIYLPNGQEIELEVEQDGTYTLTLGESELDINELVQSTQAYLLIDHNDIPTLASQAGMTSLGDVEEDEQAIANLNWRVVVLQDQAEALQPVETQTRNILFSAIAIALVAALAAIGIAQAISGPITRLNTIAGRVASGDLSAQAKVETGDETGALATTFNAMTARLRDMIGTLEQRVAERTHDLELASEVGRAVSEKEGNLSEMLDQAVELIRSRYELYYTQIYLADSAGRNLVLRAGTGDVGRQLLQRGHRLAVSASSLNSRAASGQKPVLVGDTQKSDSFLPNPLLPLTRSELAVPLVTNGKTVGVLDMQSVRADAFSSSNLPAFEVLAGQLAIAIHNSILFNQTEEARLEVEEQTRRLTSSGWQDFLNAIDRSEKIGYVFSQEEVLPLVESQAPNFDNALVVPIQIMGENIGEAQLVDEVERKWTVAETEIVRAAMSRVAQHIESLRLLAQAEQYRTAAEEVSRRLTSEGWRSYMQTRGENAVGYVFDLNNVQPFSQNGHGTSDAFKQSLVIRDETIGELAVDAEEGQDETKEIMGAVARYLSSHIENLRLSEQSEKRAHELETVAEVSSTTATLLDPDRLLQTVVDVTKERFGLYHAHIYLADDAWQTLMLAAGAGEVGRQMVADNWSIPLNHPSSIVAGVVRDRKSIIANDVHHDKESGFLSNRLLPDTRSEMAIPMIVGEKVLGVFDVQSNVANNFTEEDVKIYTTLASQVAVALQNARLYVEQAATVAQLRELDRLKSSFLANMSHELRTPLNSILGFTDVMIEGLDGDLTEFMDNDLRLIQKNGQHLLHLINDVLDMAKIESGRMNLNPEKFKVNSVLEEVISITSTLASEKNLALFIDEDSDQGIDIYADNTRLRQVMINLVNNSIKFTEKGKIVICARPMEGARVLITVKDTGIGIPADKLEAVFQEFTQVDTSTTRKAGGTGLGLPISRRLVEMHGGRLWAESTGIDGEGATFHVELPVEARITEVVEKQEK